MLGLIIYYCLLFICLNCFAMVFKIGDVYHGFFGGAFLLFIDLELPLA